MEKIKLNRNVKKVEHYVINGASFFHIKNGDSFNYDFKGFSVWNGGCGIGHTETIEQARNKIYEYAKNKINSKIEKLKSELESLEKTIELVGTEAENLDNFKNPNFHGFECNFFNGKKG